MSVYIIRRFVFTTGDPIPSVSAEVCDLPCKPGECCMGNKCWCLNTTIVDITIIVDVTTECQGLVYIYIASFISTKMFVTKEVIG